MKKMSQFLTGGHIIIHEQETREVINELTSPARKETGCAPSSQKREDISEAIDELACPPPDDIALIQPQRDDYEIKDKSKKTKRE